MRSDFQIFTGANLERLQQEISRKSSGYKNGFFVTLNTNIVKSPKDYSGDWLENYRNNYFRDAAQELMAAVYGNRFKQKRNGIKCIAAIEVGKNEGRLHAHMMVLHHGRCLYELEEVDAIARAIAARVLKVEGNSAVKTSSFYKGNDWLRYFTKHSESMMKQYGFMNIDMY